ncbi:MAG TPA: GlsB/YeaQ/YmgE family stress response membrane protein [Chitinivibrionales bacterium]|nr:GlsB/YeaQ/YmgE family stress response membrane protein [Chitinivibrionales bacterium]
MDFVWFLLVGLAAGWLAARIVKGGGYGVFGDLVVGVLGALIGGYLFKVFGVHAAKGLPANILVATIGAIVLILALRLFKRA